MAMKPINLMLFVFGWLFTADVWGVQPPTAPPSSTGSYTVSFTSMSDFSYLEERVGASGAWIPVEESLYTNVVTFSGKPSGIYYYRVVAIQIVLECGAVECSGSSTYEYHSTAISVTVDSGPPPAYDDLEEQLTYQFQARIGDANYDGRSDIYIQRVSGGAANNGVLSETILVQQPNKTFSVLAATGYQLSTASSWPVIAPAIRMDDMNADGYVDVALKGLSAFIPGVHDQLIFSSGIPYSGQGLHVTSIDDEMTKFFRDVYEFIFDRNYFNQAVGPQIGYQVSINRWVQFCDLWYGTCGPLQSYGQPINLGTFGLHQLGVSGPLATISDFTAARQNIAADVANAGCVYSNYSCNPWCGWDVVDTYGYLAAFMFWEDIWTPTTISGFDSLNYSARAYEVANRLSTVFDVGEENVPASDVAEIEAVLDDILGVPTSLPPPGTSPDETVKPRRAQGLRWLGVLLQLVSAADMLNEVIEDFRMIFHYTTSDGRDSIYASTQIINPNQPNGGPVWFTYLAYPNSDIAMDKLALCGNPRVGYFILKQKNVQISGWSNVAPKQCENGPYRRGRGWETTASSPISALPLTFVPISH